MLTSMTTRQIVSYDDITLPYDSSADLHASGRPPPLKKRKKNNQKAIQVDSPRQPTEVSTVPGNRENAGVEVDAEYVEEESRELNHEEIWDDSALVDAWEAAQQEYEMYHGNDKNWKNEPVKKSPLWYNVPIDQTTKKTDGVPTTQSPIATQSDNIKAPEPDSQPLNFDTFVPTHDPSLQLPTVDPSSFAPEMVSQDEAFSRALTAMYWGGYWTAMYHCQRHPKANDTGENGVDEAEAANETEGET